MVKGNIFSGSYNAEFMAISFSDLYKNFITLNNNFNESLCFSDLEETLELKIQGDGLGHFHISVASVTYNGGYSALKFEFDFDQTHINQMLNQLYKINEFLK